MLTVTHNCIENGEEIVGTVVIFVLLLGRLGFSGGGSNTVPNDENSTGFHRLGLVCILIEEK